MADNFPFALKTILQPGVEGAFSDDPQDPGGITMDGVTLANWQAWVGHPVTEADMRALTPAIIAPFYQRNYWNADNCGQLPSGLDLCVFDAAVNNGDGRAAKLLQALVGATPDGAIGPATQSALLAYVTQHGVAATIDAYMDARQAYYETLAGWPHDGRGWTNRVRIIRAAAHTLC